MLEVLVTLTLIAITATLMWPRLSYFSQQSEVTRARHQWENLLAFTRLQALETGNEVTLCPSQDGVHCGENWSAGWLANTEDGVRLVSVQPALKYAELHGRLTPVKPARVLFNALGESSDGEFWLCLRGQSLPVLAWRLSHSGRLTLLAPSENRTFSCEAS